MWLMDAVLIYISYIYMENSSSFLSQLLGICLKFIIFGLHTNVFLIYVT